MSFGRIKCFILFAKKRNIQFYSRILFLVLLRERDKHFIIQDRLHECYTSFWDRLLTVTSDERSEIFKGDMMKVRNLDLSSNIQDRWEKKFSIKFLFKIFLEAKKSKNWELCGPRNSVF